jgi:biopolymer transport protein ExbD
MARSKRKMAEVNSAPMADIAFLLLIFFLVTTTIATDKGIALLLPPKIEEDQPPPEFLKHQRNIFKILVNSSDRILVEDEPHTDIPLIRSMVKEFVLNFDTGFTYLANENLQFDFSFGTGLNHRMNYLSIGFSWLLKKK